MRDVFERLEGLGVRYFVTGSEALARYGEPRQTMDVDLVLDIAPSDFDKVARAFEGDFLVNDPIDFAGHLMASLIHRSVLLKVDLILSRGDPPSRSAMARRQRWDHPGYGPLWVCSLEDLILAKLEWSTGTSELQLRDCRNLIAVNRATIDWIYLELWAEPMGVTEILERVRNAA